MNFVGIALSEIKIKVTNRKPNSTCSFNKKRIKDIRLFYSL
jgi:hypothetical protein